MSDLHLSVVMSLTWAMQPGIGLIGTKSTPMMSELIGMCSFATWKKNSTLSLFHTN